MSELNERCQEALERRRGRWRRRTTFGGAVSAVATGLLLAQAGAAGATTCTNTGGSGNGYYYAGLETNSYAYAGVEGYISVDGQQVYDESFQHLLNYVGVITPLSCSVTTCGIQTGDGTGTISGHSNPSGATTPNPYMEENDVNGYDPAWSSIGLTQNDFYTVFYTGTTKHVGGNVVGLFDAYVQPSGSSPQLIGQAWLRDYRRVVPGGITEVEEVGSSENCPTLNQYEYFGTNGSGGSNSGTYLEALTGGSTQTWEAWPSSDATHHQDAPYVYSSLHDFGAFETWKSS